MPWTCRLITNPELHAHGNVDISKRAIGDMWYLLIPQERLHASHLTAQYFNGARVGDKVYPSNAHRHPLVVLLPGNNYHVIDGQCYSSDCVTCNVPREKCTCGAYTAKSYYDGWLVEGEAPLITVTPSININGRYHGHLANGVISDDVEKRVFTE